MYNQDIIEKAKSDYQELKEMVKNHKGSFNELCEKLNGFNIQQRLFFDFNYGLVQGTIYYDFQTNKINVCQEVDIWDEDEVVEKDYDMEEREV